jgi:hypothetical protein
MATYGKEGQFGREAIHKPEQCLQSYDDVYKIGKDFFRKDGMLLNQFRKIVEPGCCADC